MENEYVQYYVVNKELLNKYSMSPGKVAAQVGHVATMLTIQYGQTPEFIAWYEEGKHQKKIILEGKEKKLRELIQQGATFVQDNGLTEIPPGSLTVVGLRPMKKEDAAPFVKRLQVYKG